MEWFKKFVRFFSLLSATFLVTQLFSFLMNEEPRIVTLESVIGHLIILILGAVLATFIIKEKDK